MQIVRQRSENGWKPEYDRVNVGSSERASGDSLSVRQRGAGFGFQVLYMLDSDYPTCWDSSNQCKTNFSHTSAVSF